MYKKSRRRTLTSKVAWLIAVTASIVIIAKYVFTWPSYINTRKRIENEQIVRALDSGKTISAWMTEFREVYGNYPDERTARIISKQVGGGCIGNAETANDYLRQLFVSGIAKSEQPFHVKPPCSNEDTDVNILGGECLKEGELGYGYIMDSNRGISPDNPERVILVAPLLNGGKQGEFDKNAFFGKAVLVCCDGSVLIIHISEDNRVRMSDGRDLMETGDDTMWGTEIMPVIKPPIFK